MATFGAVAAIVAVAALGRPAAAARQEGLQTQQTQAEVPVDWAERAGICRQTERGCEGRSSMATRLTTDEGVLLEGDGTRVQDGEEICVTAGDFWRTLGGTTHSFRAGPGGACILDIFSPPRDDYKRV